MFFRRSVHDQLLTRKCVIYEQKGPPLRLMPGGRVPTRDGSLFSNENARVPHPYAQGTGGNENPGTTSTLITHRQGMAESLS